LIGFPKMMKLVIISVLLGLTHSAKIKCFVTGTGTDKKVEAKECTADGDKCSGPLLNLLEGITDQAYACGECASGTEAKCATCTGAECNKVLVKADDFMCDTFKFDTASSSFKAEKKQQACKAVKDGTNKCNKPGDEAKAAADYTNTKNKGCGECEDAAQKTAKKCAEYNGAAGLTAFLLPLLAAFYTLF